MASILTAPKSHNFPNLLGRNYEAALNQSIESFITSLQNSNTTYSTNFTSEFQQFVQSKADPPLESIWAFTSSVFNPKTEPLDRILAINDLFQLIVSCSASCNSVKSIALVAPVVYHLHKCILDVKGSQLESKKERKINREIKALVDSIIGYVNVCCDGVGGNHDDDLEGLIRPLGDLISFWVGMGNKSVESLKVFFPLLSCGIVERIGVEGCAMVDLAGFVVAEAFLLKLFWKIREEGFVEKKRDELRSWVVGSVTGFGNSYFYATLLSMLLEPILPIASLMNLENEDGLWNVLFDALILVEYTFLSPESLGKLPAKHTKRVILTKLMATYEAVELFRDRGDQTKAVHYMNAFSSSGLRSLICKWIKSETGNDMSNNEPAGLSPKAFLRWMLNIENRGIKLFDDDMAKFRTTFNSKEESEKLADMEGKQLDSDLLFYIDNKGQEQCGDEEVDKMSAAFMSAAHAMQSSEQGGRGKRKTKSGKKSKRAKSIKYNVLENSSVSGERSPGVPRNGNLNSGSDVENPSSDEDMEMRG